MFKHFMESVLLQAFAGRALEQCQTRRRDALLPVVLLFDLDSADVSHSATFFGDAR